jgi:hypothetical protein
MSSVKPCWISGALDLQHRDVGTRRLAGAAHAVEEAQVGDLERDQLDSSRARRSRKRMSRKAACKLLQLRSSRFEAPMRPVFMRSWPSRYLATVQPLPSSCTRFATGTRHVVEEHLVHLVRAVHQHERPHRYARRLHVDEKERKCPPAVARRLGSVRTRQKIQSA